MSEIPLKYLLETSRNILGEYQLSRLNKATLLKKEIRERHEQMIDNLVEAAFALWLREHRDQILELCSSVEVEKLGKGG
jgi:hypothetical protein